MDNLVLKGKKKRMVVTSAPPPPPPNQSGIHTSWKATMQGSVRDASTMLQFCIGMMLEIQELLEEWWSHAVQTNDPKIKQVVAETGFFFLVGYCGILRGFELTKVVLTELRNQVQLEAMCFVLVHVGIPLRGCFKARAALRPKY